ncbi:MAG TPA: multicopper oxidase domain-containing protein [Gemmatimonadaceae bacterium]|nr:multicopper oxidase domain-containing protein [Gemmatimonadaceae bacterium]
MDDTNDRPGASVRPDTGITPAASAFDAPSTRRAFLQRASVLSLAIPGIGAALASCGPAGKSGGAGTAAAGASQAPGVPRNPDSRLDTALHAGAAGATTPTSGAASVAYHRFDPALPPLSSERTLRVHFTSRAAPIRISDDTVVAAWTFEGDTPGPIVHCRAGDTVEFTLTNDADMPHSMDFHAAQINPKVAFRSVAKGQSVTYTFKPRYAGAFLYHCGTAPVLMHIGTGMYGAIIVSPAEPLPPAREFVLVEGEMYLGPAVNGVRPFDYTKMLSTLPDFVAFNGRPDQYARDPIHVKVGDRVRFWMVNAGPTHPCAFHVVGEQFDTVYLGAPPGNAIHGVQTFEVAAGGGMCFELVCDVPGEFPFVNHAFGHGQKGAIGYLVVDA